MPEKRKPRLLVIDDDVDLVASVTAVMERAGWAVRSAANGAAGIQRAREETPDLIILDVLMPRQDGLSTYEQLRKDSGLQAVPIIVLTSVAEKLGFGFSQEDMFAHYGHAPEAFLHKPFEPSILLSTVTRLTGRGV